MRACRFAMAVFSLHVTAALGGSPRIAALTNESEPGTDEEQASMFSTQERNGES